MTGRLRCLLLPLMLGVCATAAPPAGRKAPPWEKPRLVGRSLFLENCSVCHEAVKPVSAKLGPSLARFKQVPPERAEPFRQYMLLKMKNGGPALPSGVAMPSFTRALNETEMNALADYLLPDAPSTTTSEAALPARSGPGEPSTGRVSRSGRPR